MRFIYCILSLFRVLFIFFDGTCTWHGRADPKKMGNYFKYKVYIKQLLT